MAIGRNEFLLLIKNNTTLITRRVITMADIKLKQGIRFFQEAAKETIEVRKEIERLRQAIVLEEVAARNGNPNPRRLLTIIESIQKQKTQLAFLLVNAGRISNTCERLLYTGINYRG